ncbi:MAG: hypothetical protein ACHQJ6_09260, partial [Candidatus Berkiellales bacterium]
SYNYFICYYAPRLGIPSSFARFDSSSMNIPLIDSLFSAISPIEKEYWEKTTVETLATEIRDAMNTRVLIPLEAIHQWYNDFIDTHVTGTPDEKEALKEIPPYEVEFHGAVTQYRLKEEIIHLMLLDFGIIALTETPDSPENTFLPAKTLRFSAARASSAATKTAAPSAASTTPTATSPRHSSKAKLKGSKA